MAKEALQRASFKILTVPLSILVVLVRLLKHKSITEDYLKCINHLKSLDKTDGAVDASLIECLVLAEDHRSHLHFGVDQYAIARAILVRFIEGKVQGASTIEQQLVRTVTGRYERTLRRKIREQILSIMISSDFAKEDIASAYLRCAFFGSELIGSSGIRDIRKKGLCSSDEEIIACLKYPMPLKISDIYRVRYLKRIEHIKSLKLSGKSRQVLTAVKGADLFMSTRSSDEG